MTAVVLEPVSSAFLLLLLNITDSMFWRAVLAYISLGHKV